MDVKFGKIRPKNNIFLNSSADASDENFFASGSNFESNSTKQAFTQRINDFDSSILENNAYQLISDEMFKIEHKMSILEDNLSKINSELEALRSLGSSLQISELKIRKQKLEQELVELDKKYSELGLSSRISGQIASAVNFTSGRKSSVFFKVKTFIARKILAKISKKINQTQKLKDALENLSNINSGVDELIKLQVPYGETAKRYEKLTAYLNKANIIHSQITKNVNAITQKNNIKKAV